MHPRNLRNREKVNEGIEKISKEDVIISLGDLSAQISKEELYMK